MACAASSGCAPRHQAPQQATIAAAADLQFALDDILGGFRRAHPSADIRVVYGSSGNFYTQIRGGAPFDLFLSANLDYPRRLAGDGLAVPESLFTYAVGRIVVWAPAGSPLDPARLGMRALEAPEVRHVAIANPEHAPYGRAAVAAMKSMGVYDRVSGKLVLGENVAQALQFVESGARPGPLLGSPAGCLPCDRAGRRDSGARSRLAPGPRPAQLPGRPRRAGPPETVRLFPAAGQAAPGEKLEWTGKPSG
jgi:molybdate transport system substrate-binding protein